jgi:hypothetical protein
MIIQRASSVVLSLLRGSHLKTENEKVDKNCDHPFDSNNYFWDQSDGPYDK